MSGTRIIEDIPRLLDFLGDVNDFGICLKGEGFLRNAWRRYEKLWIPLLRKHEGNDSFFPPLDVHWMWHVHFHNPHAYHKDLEELGGVLDHKYPSKESDGQGKSLWEREYPSEPFDPPSDINDIEGSLQGFVSSFSYDLLEASNRQQDFFYQVSLPHFRNKEFHRECYLRYEKFLRLKAENPGSFIVPFYDIDLAWHTHMSRPLYYKEETSAILGGGKMLDHTDSVGKKDLNDSHKQTTELWKEKYSKDYMISGVCHRGNPPNGKLRSDLPDLSPSIFFKEAYRQLKLDPAMYFSSLHPLKTKDYELNLKVTECNSLGEEVVLDIERIFSSETQDENTLFFLDENEHVFGISTYSSIRVEAEITAIKTHSKLCAFVFGTDSRTKLGFSQTIKPFSDEESFKMELELCAQGSLKINFESMNGEVADGGARFFRTIPGEYSETDISDNYKELLGPSPSDDISQYKAATHSVLDARDDSNAFDVHLSHSLELGMSSIQVLKGKDVLSFAHLITQKTLGVEYIDPFNKYKQSPWRGMIIKDNDGDWGILIGMWTGATKSVQRQGPSGLHIRGVQPQPGKPGHFACTFLKLKSNEAGLDFVIPNGSSQVFESEEFSLHIPNKCSVNLSSGELVLHSGAGNEVAQYTALSFAVSVLYLLVLPTPEDIDAPKKAHVPERHQPLFYKSKDIKYCVLGGIQNIRSVPSNSTYYHYRKKPTHQHYVWYDPYYHYHNCSYYSFEEDDFSNENFDCDIDVLNSFVFDNDGDVIKQCPSGSSGGDESNGGSFTPGDSSNGNDNSGGGDDSGYNGGDNSTSGEGDNSTSGEGDNSTSGGADNSTSVGADNSGGGGDTSYSGGGGDTSYSGGGGDTSYSGGGDTSYSGGGDTSYSGGGGGCGSSCGGGED